MQTRGFFGTMQDAYGRSSSAAGRVMNKGLGRLTGNTLTETQYNQFNLMTHKLLDGYNINAFLPPICVDNCVDQLFSQLRLFDKAINSVYKKRLAYLQNKYQQQQQYSDPGIADTERKIQEVEGEIAGVQNIQSEILSALQKIPGAAEDLDDYNSVKARNAIAYVSSSSNVYIDPFTMQFLLEGFGNILSFMGQAAMEVLKGGKTRRRRRRAKKSRRRSVARRNTKRRSHVLR